MDKTHHYQTQLEWKGNEGKGTAYYTAYSRAHEISGIDKQHLILGSSDPSFRGDKTRYNPEELFLSSISACHMLWYLHLCATHNITVISYTDKATATMAEKANGSGSFAEVTLYPTIAIVEHDKAAQALALHHKANEMCFIANSCNFPIYHKAKIT